MNSQLTQPTMRKRIPAAGFLLTLICFLMPFAEISCQGQTLGRFSGLQLATGTTVQEPSLFGAPKERRVRADLVVLSALLAAAAGLGVALWRGGRLSGGLGIAGAVLLLVFKSQSDKAALEAGGGLMLIEYGFGFWGALLLFGATGIAAFVLARGRAEEDASADFSEQPGYFPAP